MWRTRPGPNGARQLRTRLIHICNMSHSHVQYASFGHAMCLIQTCNMPHSHMQYAFFELDFRFMEVCSAVCVVVRCGVLQCVAVCCSALQQVAARCSVLLRVAACYSGTF